MRPAAAQFSKTIRLGSASPYAEGSDRIHEVLKAGQNDPNAQMMVRADELQYDNANNRILAIGNVQIYYKRLHARGRQGHLRAEDQAHARRGQRRLTEADGKVLHGEIIDLTRRVPRRLRRLAAARSRRQDALCRDRAPSARSGRYTVFQSGVYTACEPCKDDPKQAAALAGARDPHHSRRDREDDLFRGRAARILRRSDVLLAVPLDARSDGEAQDRPLMPKFGYSTQNGVFVSPHTSGRLRRITT
jgi:hypothetical protein